MIQTIKMYLISCLLVLSFTLSARLSAEEADKADSEKKITITGTRIKRSETEGATPITVISAADIERAGFSTVYDVLNALPQASGAVQSEFFIGGFTPNAMVVNLRGMGPGYTLLLVNGKRITDYPMPYNGQSNFFNMGSIPTAAIEKIEILSGSASAIYGSDAVAGVINIITKTDIEDTIVSIQIGDTYEGAGESLMLQAIGGFISERFNWTWTVEYNDVEPIFVSDRDFFDDYTDRPDYNSGDPIYNGWNLIHLNYWGSPIGVVDPTEEVCDRFEEFDYVLNRFSQNYGGSDYLCGSYNQAKRSFQSERSSLSVYNSLSYDINENVELFGQLMFWKNDSVSTLGNLDWVSPNPFIDANTGNYSVLGRYFQYSELGKNTILFDEESVNFNLGVRGVIGADAYDYEISVNQSTYDYRSRNNAFKEEVIDEFMLGELLGEFDGFPVYAPDMENFYTPLTPENAANLTGLITETAESESTSFNASLAGELLEMPSGVAEFALFAAYNDQSYDLYVDPRYNNPEGFRWYGYAGTQGGGSRHHYAIGGELELPLLDSLTTNVALRYDDYADVGNAVSGVGGAPTYNISLEWRPTDSFLIRAKRATSFRAPDMHYVFAAESEFFANTRDYWACMTDADPDNDTPQACNTFASITGTRVGEPTLEEEEGVSNSIGIVYEPETGLFVEDDSLFISLDIFEITLNNKITDYSRTKIMQLEALCRTGQADPNSAACIDAISRVTRHPDDGSPVANLLLAVRTGPINSERAGGEGIDFRAKYQWGTTAGAFNVQLDWYHVLNAYYSESIRDPEKWRDDVFNGDYRSKVKFSVGWSTIDWHTTLTGIRSGSLPRADWEGGRTRTLATYNLNVSYNLSPESRISLSVQNLLNEKPFVDDTRTWWPYFQTGQTTAVGREMFLKYEYAF